MAINLLQDRGTPLERQRLTLLTTAATLAVTVLLPDWLKLPLAPKPVPMNVPREPLVVPTVTVALPVML